jgi:putative spermidine/putrescine transport system permease protein
MAGVVLAGAAIFLPLSSLVIWSFAEKWYWPHLFPQQIGLFYWAKVLQGDMLRALKDGFLIAVVVTVLTLLVTIPLAYVLARLPVPFKPLILMVFLLPQAFPQLPVFVNSTTLLYRVNLGGKLGGVILIHMVGALVFAVWTMTAVFKSVPETLEEAAINLGASRFKAFYSISLPLATPVLLPARCWSFCIRWMNSPGRFWSEAPLSSPCRSTCTGRAWGTSYRWRRSARSCSWCRASCSWSSWSDT